MVREKRAWYQKGHQFDPLDWQKELAGLIEKKSLSLPFTAAPPPTAPQAPLSDLWTIKRSTGTITFILVLLNYFDHQIGNRVKDTGGFFQVGFDIQQSGSVVSRICDLHAGVARLCVSLLCHVRKRVLLTAPAAGRRGATLGRRLSVSPHTKACFTPLTCEVQQFVSR